MSRLFIALFVASMFAVAVAPVEACPLGKGLKAAGRGVKCVAQHRPKLLARNR